MAVPVRTQPTFQPGPPRVLFEGRYFRRVLGPPAYDITPDGQRFVMGSGARTGRARALQIVYIPDFSDELKAKMGAAGQ